MVQGDAYHHPMNPTRLQTHCERTAMKAVAAAPAGVLTAVVLVGAAWSQTTQTQTYSRPHEIAAVPPSTANAGARGPGIAVAPFVQPVLVARRLCYDEPIAPQRSPLNAGAAVGGTAGGAVVNPPASRGPAGQGGSARRWTTANTDTGPMAVDSGVHANAGWLVTTQAREDRGRGVQAQVQVATESGVMPPPHPGPAHRIAPAPGAGNGRRVDCESAFPHADSDLVLDILIGFGAHHGVPRHDGRGGRLP